MAGDWIKMRSNLHSHVKVVRLASRFSCSPAAVVFDLYRLAGWFSDHGKYGKMHADVEVVDMFLARPGFAAELSALGWLADNGGVLTLRSFCDVSATRKSLGKKIRAQVLAKGFCENCGATGVLEIDHKVPIIRGGSCEIENLQALCIPCNRRKGRKTMEEFTK